VVLAAATVDPGVVPAGVAPDTLLPLGAAEALAPVLPVAEEDGHVPPG